MQRPAEGRSRDTDAAEPLENRRARFCIPEESTDEEMAFSNADDGAAHPGAATGRTGGGRTRADQ